MPLALFDLDGTLVDQAAAARTWALEFAAVWRLTPPQAESMAQALAERRPKGEVFAELVRTHDLPVEADAVWSAYRRHMPELVRCTPADLAALRRLREAGWVLGIATNGEVDNQEGKLRRTGLDRLVDGWVVSAEIGVRKPDPAMFAALADRLGHRLDGWMIGDSLVADIAGGAAAGLRTAWITDDPARAPGEVIPDLVAGSVAAAVERILASD